MSSAEDASDEREFERILKALDGQLSKMTPLPPLDRASRRRLERALAEDDRRGVGAAEDAAFFEANPDRTYRMRLATLGEIAAFDVAGRAGASSADGLWWLVVVRQLAPGERAVVRIYTPLPSWPLDETSEQLVRAVFDTVVWWQS
jgi:hypothetical protein